MFSCTKQNNIKYYDSKIKLYKIEYNNIKQQHNNNVIP